MEEGATVLCVDKPWSSLNDEGCTSGIANGIGDSVHIMAGNVATGEGANALLNGGDSVRVGVGGGSICSTRLHQVMVCLPCSQ